MAREVRVAAHVANMPLQPLADRNSIKLAAMQVPAYGSVPFPSSSTSTKECSLTSSATCLSAEVRICHTSCPSQQGRAFWAALPAYLTSLISTAKAERPSSGESPEKERSMKASV